MVEETMRYLNLVPVSEAGRRRRLHVRFRSCARNDDSDRLTSAAQAYFPRNANWIPPGFWNLDAFALEPGPGQAKPRPRVRELTDRGEWRKDIF
jgi:hypothetical protein